MSNNQFEDIYAVYETEEDLRRAVEKEWGSKLSDEQWEKYRQIEKSPPYGYEDVHEIKLDLEDDKDLISLETEEKISTARIRSEIIACDMEPWIKKDRQFLFGTSNPPFENLEVMENWILDEVANREIGDRSKIHILDYPCSDGYVRRIEVAEGTILQKLQNVSKARAFELGVDDASALEFILMGTYPIRSPFVCSYMLNPLVPADGLDTFIGEITITIREPIHDREILEAYRLMREKVWGRKRNPRKLKKKDATLVKFVIERTRNKHEEPIPEQIWQQMMKDWDREYPDWAFGSKNSGWKSFHKRFMDVYKRLFPNRKGYLVEPYKKKK